MEDFMRMEDQWACLGMSHMVLVKAVDCSLTKEVAATMDSA